MSNLSDLKAARRRLDEEILATAAAVFAADVQAAITSFDPDHPVAPVHVEIDDEDLGGTYPFAWVWVGPDRWTDANEAMQNDIQSFSSFQDWMDAMLALHDRETLAGTRHTVRPAGEASPAPRLTREEFDLHLDEAIAQHGTILEGARVIHDRAWEAFRSDPDGWIAGTYSPDLDPPSLGLAFLTTDGPWIDSGASLARVRGGIRCLNCGATLGCPDDLPTHTGPHHDDHCPLHRAAGPLGGTYALLADDGSVIDRLLSPTEADGRTDSTLFWTPHLPADLPAQAGAWAAAFRDYEERQVEIAVRQGDLEEDTLDVCSTVAWLLDSLHQHPVDLIHETTGAPHDIPAPDVADATAGAIWNGIYTAAKFPNAKARKSCITAILQLRPDLNRAQAGDLIAERFRSSVDDEVGDVIAAYTGDSAAVPAAVVALLRSTDAIQSAEQRGGYITVAAVGAEQLTGSQSGTGDGYWQISSSAWSQLQTPGPRTEATPRAIRNTGLPANCADPLRIAKRITAALG